MDPSPEAKALLAILAKTVGAEIDWLVDAKGYDRNQLRPLIEELAQQELIEVQGPPNAEAALGCDVQRAEITALGYISAA